MIKYLLIIFAASLLSNSTYSQQHLENTLAHKIEYDLYVKDTTVNYTGSREMPLRSMDKYPGLL